MKNNLFLLLWACSLVPAQIGAAQISILPLPNAGNVTLTLDEYNKLVELAARPPKNPDIAPLPYAVDHANLNLRVENGAVLGTVQLDGEVLRKGVSPVPLTTGMTILDAHQSGKAVPLEQENGTDTAFLPGPGAFSIDLETGLPVRIEAGRASFSLPVPAAGSVQLDLVIPGDHTFANVSPGIITSRKSESGHTLIEATLVPGQPANIWWTTREVTAPAVPHEARFLADEKTLVSISESEMRIAVLAEVTVVQGAPSQFEVQLPEGFELTGATGPTLDSTETHPRSLILNVNAPAQRSHEFLISMERSLEGVKAEAPFLSFKGAQRETGEVLIEGAGTMEITATEGGGLKRMDVKEANPYLRSLAHFPPQAAFRYHRQAGESPTLALSWVQFPDSSVLAAVAENAEVTTLVTAEGKSLTQIRLTVKNQAQPFLKVVLPPGVNILSADVGGEPVKPVQGPDGSRVPLLRPGFRPNGSYPVSFVFLHSGAPFAKKGGAELSLPNMDIPISLLSWEIFLPEQYKVKDFGGDVIAASLVPSTFQEETAYALAKERDERTVSNMNLAFPGQMGGYVIDPSGAVIPNARVTITSAQTGETRTAMTDSEGRWLVAGLASGGYKAQTDVAGFKTGVYNLAYDSNRPSMYRFRMDIGAAAETVTVEAVATQVDTESEELSPNGRNYTRLVPLAPGAVSTNSAPSANVVNLQQRVAGVLPIAIDVPRAGTSFAFVRPLVLDEETKVTFSYKTR
ncbi:MAG TPA: carboxypeptidase-like regulatory domain-containing protein [Verrucomicrobiae bacterium]|nr:carboxypeptidase-like regulatory domain-containing protein [Verrucomicrobiae bacterium]